MRNFNNSVFLSEKRETNKAGSVFSLFRLRPTTAWKIYLQQWMLPDTQPGFCWEGWAKSNFFAQKWSDLGSVLNKLMQQLERVTNGGVIIKYIVTVYGGLGRAHSRLAIFVILQLKRSNFYVSLIAFRTF